MNICEKIRSLGIEGLIHPDTANLQIQIKEQRTGQKLLIKYPSGFDAVGFIVEHHDFSNQIFEDSLMKKGCEAAVCLHDPQSRQNYVILCELKMTNIGKALQQVKGGLLASQYLSSFAFINENGTSLKIPNITFKGLIATNRKALGFQSNLRVVGDVGYLHGARSFHANRLIL